MRVVILFILLLSTLYASDMHILTKELNLIPGTKATIQWERVFSSQRRMEKYNIHLLNKKTQNELKLYLIQHSADSDQPIVPGL